MRLTRGFHLRIGPSYESIPRRFIPQPLSETIGQAIGRVLEVPVAAVPRVLLKTCVFQPTNRCGGQGRKVAPRLPSVPPGGSYRPSAGGGELVRGVRPA